MVTENQLEYCNRKIGEIATDLSQAYVQDGDFLSFYLGQISIPLQLALFQPFALEISVLLVYMLRSENFELSNILRAETEEIAQDSGLDGKAFVEERLDCYAKTWDPLNSFISFCQKVAEANAHQLNVEMNDSPIQPSINDRRFIAISKAVSRIQQVVHNR